MQTETLHSSGRYTYRLNAEPTGVVEPWTRHLRSDGVRVTRVTRDAAVFGATITLEAIERRNEAGSSNWQILIDWANTRPGAVTKARASYLITPDAIFAERIINDGRPQYQDLARPDNLVLMPLMRCFYGHAIARLASIGGGEPLPCFVPWIHDPANADQLLTVQLEPRSARLAAVEDLSREAGEPVECMRYKCIGGNYSEACDFWIDGDGELLRYRWPQRPDALWQVDLSAF